MTTNPPRIGRWGEIIAVLPVADEAIVEQRYEAMPNWCVYTIRYPRFELSAKHYLPEETAVKAYRLDMILEHEFRKLGVDFAELIDDWFVLAGASCQ